MTDTEIVNRLAAIFDDPDEEIDGGDFIEEVALLLAHRTAPERQEDPQEASDTAKTEVLVVVEGGCAREVLPPGVDTERVTIWDWDADEYPDENAQEIAGMLRLFDTLPHWMQATLNRGGDVDAMRRRNQENVG